MLEAIRIIDVPARSAAVIRFKIPMTELPKVMAPAVAELLAVVAAQRMTPEGPLFNHYWSMDSGIFDFEVGIPLSGTILPSGRVQPGELPAAKTARTIYRGPYEGLHAAWREFGSAAKEQGLRPAPGLWECYIVGPESSSDPSAWRTELNQPLLE